ncbi:MAG: four helix bundle protein [Marinilabiliaceae bacterium]|nr:four helix bundle protein [Marinilabiliaceae bacterium]
MEISYSSFLEVLNQLILANDLNFLSDEKLNTFRANINELSNKINSFYKGILFDGVK